MGCKFVFFFFNLLSSNLFYCPKFGCIFFLTLCYAKVLDWIKACSRTFFN